MRLFNLSLSLFLSLSLSSLSLSLSFALSGRWEDRRTCISPLTVHSQEYTASPEAEFSPDGVLILALNLRVNSLKFWPSVMKIWGCVYWRCITDAHLAQYPAEHQHDGIGVSLTSFTMGLFKLYFALCTLGLFCGKLVFARRLVAGEFWQRDGCLYGYGMLIFCIVGGYTYVYSVWATEILRCEMLCIHMEILYINVF